MILNKWLETMIAAVLGFNCDRCLALDSSHSGYYDDDDQLLSYPYSKLMKLKVAMNTTMVVGVLFTP